MLSLGDVRSGSGSEGSLRRLLLDLTAGWCASRLVKGVEALLEAGEDVNTALPVSRIASGSSGSSVLRVLGF
eukprot:3227475-Rhodomonas_salina.1